MREVLYYDPWANRWASYPEYALAIHQRIKLARTWRYKARRIGQRLRNRPVDASERYLICKLYAVARAEGKANPFDFGPIRKP